MHQQTAHDFRVIEKSLRRTLQSLSAQTDQNFLWVVVCNAIPDLGKYPENVVFHVVDFEPANSEDMRSKMADKGAKLVSGLLFLRQFAPQYVYFLDADDWLNRSLNQFLNSKKTHQAGWHVDAGYVADIYTRRIQKKYRLDRFCGSTFAANYATLMELLAVDETLDEYSKKSEIVDKVPRIIIEEVFFSHDHDTFFRAHGLKPRKMTLDAVVWVRGTGENVWVDGASRRIAQGLQLDRKKLALFGIDDESVSSYESNTLLDYARHMYVALRSLGGSFFVKNTRYLSESNHQ